MNCASFTRLTAIALTMGLSLLASSCSTTKTASSGAGADVTADTASGDTGAAVFDAGATADSQAADAAGTDAVGSADVPAADGLTADAGAIDAGAIDTAAQDGGTVAADALVDAAVDASKVDGAAIDAGGDVGPGTSDAKGTDATSTDATSTDATSTDAGAGDGASADTFTSPNAGSGCSDGTREGFVDAAKYPKVAGCGGAWSVPGIHNVTPACNQEAGNTGKNKAGTGCNVSDLCAVGWRVCYGKADLLSRNALGCRDIMEGTTEPGFFLARSSSMGAFNCSQDSTKFGDPGTLNDLFGCGNLGCSVSQGTCAGDKKGCDPAALACVDKTTCNAGVCFPLNAASHDLCKTLRHMTGCKCSFTDPPANTVVSCAPSSGGCGWCKPVDYWEKKLAKTFPEAWDCGTSGTKEAANVVKKHVELGGVLCCQM